MPASKIQNESEVKRWYEEGKTYAWMVNEYRRKYGLKVTPSMFSNLRSRRGWSRRIARDDELIPWAVAREHRWDYTVMMLRYEARQRSGLPLAEDRVAKLESWREGLLSRGEVVAYDAVRGFHHVRRTGSDDDLIRRPVAGLTERRPR